jgi:exodeoxyribonuclease VII small subunit
MAKKITVDELLATTDPLSRVDALTFEEGMELLEQLVDLVEAGKLSLERSVLSYERGILLVEELRKRLDAAEEKLKKIDQKEEEKDAS